MTSYVVEMQEDMAESLTCAFLKQIRKDTGDGGVMEACDIILTYLNPIISGFTTRSKSFLTLGLQKHLMWCIWNTYGMPYLK